MFRCQAFFTDTGEIWQSKIFTTEVRVRRYMRRHFLPMLNRYLAVSGRQSAEVSIICL